ncbi:MAG: hypothetical protein BGO49_24435 [Planctomycetales bacterium 71-10]|nr:MAG: hypothetical protein BGO49_24435 [Planctomycetales bacterium 71-10]
MLQIPIASLPNQAFTVILDGATWDVAIRAAAGVMTVSLSRDGAPVVDNARAVAGSFILQAEYEESGNFFFATQDFELPDYAKFNVSQHLIYIGAAELAAIRSPKTPPVTAADFDPVAALPLRFAPQGYA